MDSDLVNDTISHDPLLPPAYSRKSAQSPECARRLGSSFIKNAVNTSTNYCTDDSSSQLNCFRTHTSVKTTDIFCIGTPATFDAGESKFQLGCEPASLTKQQKAAGAPKLSNFPSSWYETGPKTILSRHVKLDPTQTIQSTTDSLPKNYTILVRREAPIDNLFHHGMQILSVFLTLDILQLALSPTTNTPFYSPSDIDNTRVVIFDDHPEGPFYDQWHAFAKRPVTRIKDLSAASITEPENIIIPLAGTASGFWQHDWDATPCTESAILQVFSQRMLAFYGVEEDPGPPDRPLVLTFIARTEKRSLIDKEDYIRDLQAAYPDVEINLVNFASLSFAEQLQTVRRTDVLAGVHGAGLTHAIFLPSASAVVEIMPYGFNHKGFRNLAKELGHGYYTSHAKEDKERKDKGWQFDDVVIERERFMELMGAAIKSMYHRGLRDDDVN